MGTQGYRANYREAYECANIQLEEIYSQYHELRARKEQLESAVTALGPFLRSANLPSREEVHMAEPVPMGAAWEPELHPEQIMRAIAPLDPVPAPVAPEPVVAPSYAPVSETNIDPIQARINRALGLAVA
jgi:hypothetical protein